MSLARANGFTLSTGHLSTANIRLYERLSYTEERHETLKPGVDLAHMTKAP